MKLVATERMLIAGGAVADKKWAGVLTTWKFARVWGRTRNYEPVYVFAEDKETPDVKTFNYSQLHPIN